MYGSMEQSTPAEAPALGPAELKAVRKLLATNGDDARSTGLSHESQASSASTLPTLATQALSASTLAKLEAASDEVELQQSVWDLSTGNTTFPGCCSRCGDGGCAPGYTYAGQFVTSLEMVSSTYPDFYPFCGYAPNCGNTCCVPSDE